MRNPRAASACVSGAAACVVRAKFDCDEGDDDDESDDESDDDDESDEGDDSLNSFWRANICLFNSSKFITTLQ